jgi:hypothetical protein
MRENLITVRSRDFHGDQKSRDLYEKFQDLSTYEIFQHTILKSQSFKKRAVYWYFYDTLNIFSQLKLIFFRLIVDYRLKDVLKCRKCAKNLDKNQLFLLLFSPLDTALLFDVNTAITIMGWLLLAVQL